MLWAYLSRQSTQLVLPASGWKLPATQARAAPAAMKNPGMLTQAEDCPDLTADDVFRGHSVHAIEALVSEYVPPSHTSQTSEPGAGLYSPVLHAAHPVAPVPEYPARQKHAANVSANALDRLCAGHGRSTSSPVQYEPAGHGEQSCPGETL